MSSRPEKFGWKTPKMSLFGLESRVPAEPALGFRTGSEWRLSWRAFFSPQSNTWVVFFK